MTGGTVTGSSITEGTATMTSGNITGAVGITSGNITLGGTLITATGAELNYASGVTSSIQTQFNTLLEKVTYERVEKTTMSNITYNANDFVVKRIIFRNCNGGNRTDITPTAAEIVAELTNPVMGSSFRVLIKNTTTLPSAHTLNFIGGTGVTITSSNLPLNPGQWVEFLIVATSPYLGSEAIDMYEIYVS
jgi:hypothetical protein